VPVQGGWLTSTRLASWCVQRHDFFIQLTATVRVASAAVIAVAQPTELTPVYVAGIYHTLALGSRALGHNTPPGIWVNRQNDL
jgi:hypothetical protein